MSVPNRFGQLLRRHRTDAGLTIKELSAASGVSVRAIGDMERGRSRVPQRRTVDALVRALGLAGAAADILCAAARSGRRAERPVPAPAGGSVSTAVSLAHRAARLARERDQATFEAVALYAVARLGGAAEVTERLDRLTTGLQDGFTAVLAAAAGALAGDDGDALERSAASFTQYGQLLLAAEAMAAAARAHRLAGRTARMRAAMERAAGMAANCQGARTPLLDMAGLGTALSRREREVATLAATMPSREVAERLGLSVHTVNNTLARAYAKLGIRNRSELSTVLRDPAEERPSQVSWTAGGRSSLDWMPAARAGQDPEE